MDNISYENDDLFDNELLSKIDLADYDIDRSYYRVCKFMKRYRRLKSKNYADIPIKITTKYKYIYVDEGSKGSNDYSVIDKYIDEDTEYKRLSKQICLITETFSQEELVYYTICLYQQKSETRAFKEIGCSNYGLIPIKNSCIIKFACALDIEVYKDDGFNNEEEEEDYQNFMELIKM
jgi:hypothetical protein